MRTTPALLREVEGLRDQAKTDPDVDYVRLKELAEHENPLICAQALLGLDYVGKLKMRPDLIPFFEKQLQVDNELIRQRSFVSLAHLDEERREYWLDWGDVQEETSIKAVSKNIRKRYEEEANETQ